VHGFGEGLGEAPYGTCFFSADDACGISPYTKSRHEGLTIPAGSATSLDDPDKRTGILNQAGMII